MTIRDFVWFRYLKGLRNVIVSVAAVVAGGAVAGGFMTPDDAANLTGSVDHIIHSSNEIINHIEKIAGWGLSIFGLVVGLLRIDTDTKIGKKE